MAISERTRSNLIVGAGVVVQTIALVLYVERRLNANEEHGRALAARVLALETEKKAASDKMDRLIDTVNDIKVGVARVEERMRKP
jgi:hypothetical protein